MQKRKNGQRNYRKIILRTIFGTVIVILFVLSTPMIYALLTYYHLPETYEKPPISQWYMGSEEPYEICEDAGYIDEHNLMPSNLQVRLVIDDKVVPMSEMRVKILHHFPSWDPGFPMHDVACTTQPDLAIGAHEVILFYGEQFQWYPDSRWVVYVEESGMIRNFHLCAL